MTLLERQRRESFMKGMFIPFMLLSFVCSLFGDTNILHADVQKVVVYNSGIAFTDMQKQSPVIVESFEESTETIASKAPRVGLSECGHIMPHEQPHYGRDGEPKLEHEDGHQRDEILQRGL